MRAGRLAQLGVMRVLTKEELHPRRLSAIMQEGISHRSRSTVDIDLSGAEKTVGWLMENPALPERL